MVVGWEGRGGGGHGHALDGEQRHVARRSKRREDSRARNGEGSGWIRDKRARSGSHSAHLRWACVGWATSNLMGRYCEVW